MAKKPSGGGSGEEITFYIEVWFRGELYELKALEGMTWGDWVDSTYNSIGASVQDSPRGDVISYDGIFNIVNRGQLLFPDDTIISEYIYEVS